MKLEVGMYLRYEGLDGDCPIIQKIIELKKPGRCGGKYKVFTDKTNDWFIDSDYIEMAIENSEIPLPSFNIIDLIEEQDLVEIEFYSQRRKKRITRLFEVDFIYDNDITFDNAHCQLNIIGGSWSNADKRLKPVFKSVVTKEQFENMKYRIGDKTNDKKRNISKNKKS